MFDKILVVCIGNICRSPIGERALRNLLPDKKIDSAGVGALVGKPADDSSIEVSARSGINLEGHEARQLTSKMCSEYDLILVMEKSHIDAVSKISQAARGKTMLFAKWVGEKNIPDPYKQSIEAFEHAFEIIEQSANEWAKKLGSK
jgi:protein-tyrosine phosphatase